MLAAYVARLRAVPATRWHEPAAEGKWSAAEEALHIVLAYEIGLAGSAGGPGMQMRVSPGWARLSRLLVLPVILRTSWFPRGATAPREVRPPAAEARGLTREQLEARLRLVAGNAANGLRAADVRETVPRFVHAYFGPVSPLTALRLLSAHTRHHTRLRHGVPRPG